MKIGGVLVCVFGVCLLASAAEPGAGIVVDAERQVWFTDSVSGVWKIDPRGEVTQVYKHPALWLAMDLDGKYASSKPDRYQRITQKGVKPALLATTSGPITMCAEGEVFYAASNESGPLHILRLVPNGDNFVVAKVPDNTKGAKLRKVNAIAVGADDTVYIAGNHTIRKVTKGGQVSDIIGPLATLDDCGKVAGIPKKHRPYLHGLAVDKSGTLYVAAMGCSSVLKVTPDGKMSTLLKGDEGWSPTGLAMYESDLYVLEYKNAGSSSKKDWAPRVRKIAADGTVSTVGTAGAASHKASN
jgi:sugar lactone lactonase YvrE